MRILLLGATGRTGKWVLQRALEKGYHINCLVRNAERIEKKEGLTIFEGNPSDENDLKEAISNCDGIISALNISRKSDFPWAKLRTPKTFLSDTMKLLTPIAEGHDIKRMVICSAWGVAETKKDIPKWFKWFINNSNISVAYKDHEKQEKILENADLNWTVVRPVGLSNSKRSEKIVESYNNEPKPGIMISRESVAKYMVDCLEKDNLIKKKVVISKA